MACFSHNVGHWPRHLLGEGSWDCDPVKLTRAEGGEDTKTVGRGVDLKGIQDAHGVWVTLTAESPRVLSGAGTSSGIFCIWLSWSKWHQACLGRLILQAGILLLFFCSW